MLVKKTFFQLAQPFNPMSSKQAIAYLRAKKLPIPKHRNARDPQTGERRDSADEEGLLELMREGNAGYGDRVLGAIVSVRHDTKASAYLSDKYVRRDGRLHPVFTIKPKTGRLSSAKPNVMNFPKGERGEAMKEAAGWILRSIISDPEWILFEFDWDSVEALLTGYFAGDPDYMAAAVKGVHDIFASHLAVQRGVCKYPLNPHAPHEEVQAFAKWLKESPHAELRQIAKKRIYAGSYGQGVMSMARDLGVSVKTVYELDAVFASMAPKVVKWQEDTLFKAHFEGRLTTPMGFTLPFFDVFQVEKGKVKKGRDGKPLRGKEATEALAFMPQSTCAGRLREVLIDLGTHEEEGRAFELLLPEHDSVKGQVRPSEMSRILPLVRASMERSWIELGGLRVGTKGKVGPTMQEMKPLAA